MSTLPNNPPLYNNDEVPQKIALTSRRAASTIENADIGSALLWMVRAGLVAALVTPLIVAPGAYFPFVVGKAIYSRSVIEIAFALWVALVIFYPRRRPRLSWVLIAFAVWLLASWVSGALGVSYARSVWSTYERMQGVADLAHWLAFAMMCATAFDSARAWRVFFSFNLLVCVVVCSLGLLSLYDYVQSDSLGVGGGRVEATLGNPTYLAGYAAVNALIGMGLLLRSFASGADSGSDGTPRAESSRRAGRSRRARAAASAAVFNADAYLRPLWIVAVALCLWTIWETASRGAVAGLGIALLILAAFYAPRRAARSPLARKAALALLAAFAAGLALFAIARTTTVLDPAIRSSQMLTRLSLVGDAADRSLRGRLIAIEAGLRAFPESPLFGWGTDNFLTAWGRHFDYEETGIETRFDRAHSKVVEELVTKGAVGLAAYMLIWAAAARALIRALRRGRASERALTAVIGAAMIAYFTQNLFLFDNTSSSLQFALLIAFAAGLEMRSRADDGETTAARESGTANRRRSAGRIRSALGGVPVRAAIATVVVALMLALTLAVNLRIYAAASAILRAETEFVWFERADLYLESIETFPGLANYPRRLLAYDLSLRLADMSDDEFDLAVRIVETAAAHGADSDPTDWVFEAGLASFFQRASIRDRAFLERAAAHVAIGLALAPRAKETLGVQREQERLEKFFESQDGGGVSP